MAFRIALKNSGSALPFALGAGVIIADAISKALVYYLIPLMRFSSFWYPYGGIGVFKDFMGIEFSLVHHINKGAAWGAFADYQEQLLWLRIVVIAALVVYTLFVAHPVKWEIPLLLVAGGAAANVIDYFLYGHVIDMFHFIFWGYDYPIFNVADSAICIGIAWLFLLTLFSNSTSQVSKTHKSKT